MILSGRFRAVGSLFAGTLFLLCATSAVLPAQQSSTLGEVARKEEERRKKVSTPAKVYTNKNLPKSAARPAASTEPGKSGAPSGAQKSAGALKPAEAQKSEQPRGEERDEEWWRKRITAARTDLQRAEMAAEAFQSRVNALTTDFAARDDPYQRAQIALDRQKTLNELERVKAEVVRLKQVISDIEEEARVAGVPPGWLR